MYEQISSNKRRSIILIILFILIIVILGYVFSKVMSFGPYAIMFAAIFAIGTSWGSYFYSDKIVLKLSGARPLGHDEFPYLDNTIEGLAIATGIPKPKAYVIDDPSPNAFATGRNPENAVVAVTTGLLQIMNRQELEGVIAHELSHVKNFDIRFMAIVSVLVGLVIIMGDIFRYSMWFGGGGGDEDNNSSTAVFLIVGLILAIFAPISAMLIQFAISRRREFLADASAAMITRYPPGLASALKKLGSDDHRLKAASNATSHLYIVTPFKGFSASNLFSTHPPIEERIKKLEEL